MNPTGTPALAAFLAFHADPEPDPDAVTIESDADRRGGAAFGSWGCWVCWVSAPGAGASAQA